MSVRQFVILIFESEPFERDNIAFYCEREWKCALSDCCPKLRVV